MHRVESISNLVRKPTHISKCSGTVEHAYGVFFEVEHDYASVSWLKRTEAEDSGQNQARQRVASGSS